MPPHFTCCSTFVESIETTPSKAQKKVAKISGILPIYLFRLHSRKNKFIFQNTLKPSLFTTSIMDRQLLRQKICQKISVIETDTFVFVVFKPKCELKWQNGLFLWYYHKCLFVLLRFFDQFFDVIIDDP